MKSLIRTAMALFILTGIAAAESFRCPERSGGGRSVHRRTTGACTHRQGVRKEACGRNVSQPRRDLDR